MQIKEITFLGYKTNRNEIVESFAPVKLVRELEELLDECGVEVDKERMSGRGFLFLVALAKRECENFWDRISFDLKFEIVWRLYTAGVDVVTIAREFGVEVLEIENIVRRIEDEYNLIVS